MTDRGDPAARDAFAQSVSLMGTVVTVQVHGPARDSSAADKSATVARAFEWFREVETSCSRFEPESEVVQLSRRIGSAVAVSATLFHATEVALAVAAASDGAFDPTIGQRMIERGFNRNYRTGETMAAAPTVSGDVNFRDVDLDVRNRTITLRKPLLLDLGAVAKGLAIDLAARELAAFDNFAIDAGGDLYLAGRNEDDQPWRVGIRHPRQPERLFGSLRVSNRAVCTSGDYERRTPDGAGHHIIDPRGSGASERVASVTVVAPAAVLADALGTAVFVLGVRRGLALLRRHGVDGLVVTSTLGQYATRGMHRDYQLHAEGASVSAADAALLHDAERPVDRRPDDPGRHRRTH